jgi:hypothetical protein
LAEKESVTNICKRTKKRIQLHAVEKSNVGPWSSQIVGFEKGQTELSDANRPGPPTTPAAQASFNVLMNSFETTDGAQTSLQLSSQ